MPEPEYLLGHSDRELRRLSLQAEFWGDATRELLQRAGLAAGMRVLDLGCGPGDVTLLAARLVEPSGTVVGVDRSAEAIETARRRAEAAKITNADFQLATIEGFLDAKPFDAMIGRFVLMYFTDPVTILKRLLPLVKPGGIVAFMEMDMVAARTVPPVEFVDTTVDWVRQTFSRAGLPIDMASRVWRVFDQAGLTQSSMFARQNVEASPPAIASRYIAETVRSLLPMMERLGVTSAAQVDIETLAERLQQAAADRHATVLSPLAVGTWSRVRA
jgi:ubiquinone/menaquinone biosynthesis C-methylase UbiE